jgi:hypothetical protein
VKFVIHSIPLVIVETTGFKKTREDGWPLCPGCGEDELFSNLLDESQKYSIVEYIDHGLKCYRCGFKWDGKEKV